VTNETLSLILFKMVIEIIYHPLECFEQ